MCYAIGERQPVAQTRRRTARRRAALLFVIGLFAGCYAYSELSRLHWRSGLGAVLLTFGCVLCLFAFVVQGHCRAPNADSRTYCRNRIYGLVFGCHLHTFERPLFLLGKGRRRPVPPARPPRNYSRGQQPAQYAASGSVPIPVSTPDERERRRSTVLFYVALASLTTGSLSTFTDLFGFVKAIT